MTSFRGDFLAKLALPPTTVWMLGAVAEAKGRHDSHGEGQLQGLAALTQGALLQSVESSNRMAGLTVAPERLRPIVFGHAKPRGRVEQAIRGYRQALSLIHRGAGRLEITPSLVRRLHDWCEPEADGENATRAMASMLAAHAHTVAQHKIHPLVTTAALTLDFFCAHPFKNGNGRVSRLLLSLALCQHGYAVGRFVSLERLMEESQAKYFACLDASSQAWSRGKHDLLPFLDFCLHLLGRAYALYEQRCESMRMAKGAKTMHIAAAINSLPAGFTLQELAAACPGVSIEMIRKVLKAKQKRYEVKALGRGPGARWTQASYGV
jgi:hypothetical protein